MAEPVWCPVFHPTKQEFSRPFADYVAAKFKENPSLPCFKVVPPAGWKPRSTPFPSFDDLTIATPIRQHAFGKTGAYRCLLVEQKPLTVSEFAKVAKEEEYKSMGHKGQAGSACATRYTAADGLGDQQLQPPTAAAATTGKDVELSERSFWASITLNPPLYGADTPVSFFDEKLPYGWNLRNLGDLLRAKDVPDIPGVTSPMAYFGMWRSFFGWHKEDADLLSINYVHFGAPKVWYCVSPQHGDRFERMADALFPDQRKECPAFIRHKDLLISPSQLRAFGIPVMQAKQQAGEFMVLNAAAYHAGFNMGFNCAEAINFATQDWIRVGKVANRCKCSVMRDVVIISMKLFDPNWVDPYASSDSSDEESEEEEGAPGGMRAKKHHANAMSRLHLLTMAREVARRKREEAEQEEQEASPEPKPGRGKAQGSEERPPAKRPAFGLRKHIPAWKTAEELSTEEALLAGISRSGDTLQMLEPSSPTPPGGPCLTPCTCAVDPSVCAWLHAAYTRARQRRKTRTARGGKGATKRVGSSGPSVPRAKRDDSGSEGDDDGRTELHKQTMRALARPTVPTPTSRMTATVLNATASDLRKQTIAALQKHMSTKPDHAAGVTPRSKSSAQPTKQPAPTPAPRASSSKSSPGGSKSTKDEFTGIDVQKELEKDPVQGPPYAVIWEGDERRYFQLVQQLKRAASSKADVLVRLMREGSDGLFYPSPIIWEERRTSLVQVRSQQVAVGSAKQLPAWKLLTLRSRILDTDLRD